MGTVVGKHALPILGALGLMSCSIGYDRYIELESERTVASSEEQPDVDSNPDSGEESPEPNVPVACVGVSCDANSECQPDTGLCVCSVGYQDEDEDGSCLPDCESTSCNGTCSIELGAPVCDCVEGFVDGLGVCDACAAGRFGASCEPCPECVQGTCDEGISGAGSCQCEGNFTGTLCNTCTQGHTGTACDQCDVGYRDPDLDGICEQECAGGTCSGLHAARGLATGAHDFILTSGTVPLHVDGEYDGGSWVLIGRGREGWNWNEAGDSGGNSSAVKDGVGTPSGFVPKYLASAIVQDLIDNTLGGVDLTGLDVRLKRAAEPFGTLWQETLIHYQARTTWSWLFNTNFDIATITLSDSVLGPGATVTDRLDDLYLINNHLRINPWPSANHNDQSGFSYGLDVEGVNNNQPDSFMWEYTTEDTAIPYTEVYLRIPSCALDGSYCGPNAVSCDDSSGPAVCSCNGTATGVRCEQCAPGFQDYDGDGVCTAGCSPADCPNPGQTCVAGSGVPICVSAEGRSCLDIRTNVNPSATDGFYSIAPESVSAPITAWCDMTTDGGGYTFFKQDTGGTEFIAFDAERFCSERGMQLFVPRTEAHLQSAYAIATNASIGPGASWEYLSLLGIYPNVRRDVCNRMGLNSGSPGCEWGPDDEGPFWVSDRTDIDEPNAGGTVVQSMNYWFDSGSYLVRNYGDSTSKSQYFMCDVGDKWGP